MNNKNTSEGLVQVAKCIASQLGVYPEHIENTEYYHLIEKLNEEVNFEYLKLEKVLDIRIVDQKQVVIWGRIISDKDLCNLLTSCLTKVRRDGVLLTDEERAQNSFFTKGSDVYSAGWVNTERV